MEGDDIRAMERSNSFLNYVTALDGKSIFLSVSPSRAKKFFSLAFGVCGSAISAM